MIEAGMKLKIAAILVLLTIVVFFYTYVNRAPHIERSVSYLEVEKLLARFEKEVLDEFEPEIMTADLERMAYWIAKYSSAGKDYSDEWK